jgi:hypothetical protein
LLAAFFTAVYVPVMRSEEAHLSALFGEPYAAYTRAVPLLWPRLTPWRADGAPPSRFRVELYRYNREYEAFLAFLLIVLALWGKMAWGR